MKNAKREALESAGWNFGDAGSFLGMAEEERQMLDIRVEAALAVRRQREAVKTSQRELAQNENESTKNRQDRASRARRDTRSDSSRLCRVRWSNHAAGGGWAVARQAEKVACKSAQCHPQIQAYNRPDWNGTLITTTELRPNAELPAKLSIFSEASGFAESGGRLSGSLCSQIGNYSPCQPVLFLSRRHIIPP